MEQDQRTVPAVDPDSITLARAMRLAELAREQQERHRQLREALANLRQSKQP